MAQALASHTVLVGNDPAEAAPRSTPPPSPEEIASHFPQFDIIECLGHGGMGVVYKARQKSLDRWVAIKILSPARAGQPGFAERFVREARTLARLNHPNIVAVFDHGESGGLYYFVMEFVDGVNLRDLLRDGKLEPKQALAIVPPICEALQYAHEKGVVHRDIKPENLLLDREGRVKIADFGIAALVGAESEAAGTPPYMAPEQADRRAEVDHRADIYAVGVVLYEMLTGERPKGQRVVAPSRKVQLDVRIDEIVLRALEKEPALRYQHASVLKTQVEAVTNSPTEGPALSPEHALLYLEGFTKFRSVSALRFAQLACIGFLGFLGNLPGWERWRGCFGFFGLLGVAYIVEAVARWGNGGGGIGNAPPGNRATPTTMDSSPARFSRTALVGAGWAGLAILCFLWLYVLSGERVRPWAEMLKVEKFGFISTELMGFVGWSATLGTTVLGWVAVGQIRRSAGRLYGLGLAMFDGLFFPMLALDYTISALLFNLGIALHWWTRNYDDVSNAQLTVASVLTWAGANFFIIRAVWRVVAKPSRRTEPGNIS